MGRCRKTRTALGDVYASVPPESGFIVPSYWVALGTEYRERTDSALAAFVELDARTSAFWTRYAARVDRTIDEEFAETFTLSLQLQSKYRPVIEPLVRTFAEFQIAHMEATGKPALTAHQMAMREPAKRPTPKRASRTAAIDAIKQALREHLRAARDHAYTLREHDRPAALLLRPTQEQLARQLHISASSVSRAINDPSDKEITILWKAANHLEQVLQFKG